MELLAHCLVCSRCLINVTLLNISDHSDNPCSGPSGWGWVCHLPDEVGDPTGSQVLRWDLRRVHCMCRDGRGIGGGHLAEPPPPGGVSRWGWKGSLGVEAWSGEKGGVGQDPLAYAAVTTPRSQQLEATEVISCSRCLYACPLGSPGSSGSPDSVTRVHKADTISQVAECCGRGTDSPRPAPSNKVATSLLGLFEFK